MLAEFIALIESYLGGKLNGTQLTDSITRFVEKYPDITPTELLESTQSMLTSGKLAPKDFRLISETLTELNIQRALEAQHESAITANDGEVQETIILPPGAPGDDETLIEPYPPSAADNQKTLILKSTGNTQQNAGEQNQKPFYDTPGNENKTSEIPAILPSKVGTVLKKRFELLEIIGRGGMGKVFKARDLVKVQARDSNPYVAIKVLSERFKKHSRAFIALQREASKAQRLAHPNIATVYDFDHDEETIYMTMELLHGQPFDKLIGNLPPGGLPLNLALHYIEGLCNGLGYAHKQNLIHCDLKPANIFLCDNGSVKLLDFGITRAIKKEQQKSGDETLFDPASLKALTPAYASVEMFRGDPPDPRDDIYALACVAYELLTGVHPYKKVAAHKALELNLKPTPIKGKGISRKQQKALYDALALERSKRLQSVEKFMEGMQKPKSRLKQLVAGSAIIMLLGAALLIKPIQTEIREDAELEMIQSIKSGNQTRLAEMLNNIQDTDENTRAYLTSVLRKEIIRFYEEKINAVIEAKEQKYNFPEAARLLNQVSQLYPDSASLAEARKQLNAKKARLVNTLLKNYSAQKSKNKDTSRILEILAEAEPSHPLLAEYRNSQ